MSAQCPILMRVRGATVSVARATQILYYVYCIIKARTRCYGTVVGKLLVSGAGRNG